MSQGVKREKDAKHKSPDVILLLDTSGSMEGSEQAMVNGTNEFLQGMEKEKPGFTYLIYTFSESRFPSLRRSDGEELKMFPLEKYDCGGLTSLYDTIGKTIAEEENCLIVVATDGEDTFSKLYTQLEVQTMIFEVEHKKGIKFKFIAQGPEAFKAVSSISCREEDVIAADPKYGMSAVLEDRSFIYACSQSFVNDEDDQDATKKSKVFHTQHSIEY